MYNRNRWLYAAVVGAAVCGVVWFGAKTFNASEAMQWSWGLAAVLCAGMGVWIFFQKDPAPDLFHELGVTPFERKGLCLILAPEVDAGELTLAVMYQNRYANPCSGELLIKPLPSANACGLSTLRLNVQCEGGGAGMVKVRWLAQSPQPGRNIECVVGVNVDYPDGRGTMLRSREGIALGSIDEASVPEFLHLLQTPAKFTFPFPEGVCVNNSRADVPKPVPATVHAPLDPLLPGPARPQPDSEPPAAIGRAQLELQRSGSRPVQVTCEHCRHEYQYVLHRTATGTAEDPDQPTALRKAEEDAQRKLAEMLANGRDIVPCPKCGQLTREMRRDQWSNRGTGLETVLFGGFIILVGVGICLGVNWVGKVTGRLFYVIGIFGLLVGAFGALLVFQGLVALITGRSDSASAPSKE